MLVLNSGFVKVEICPGISARLLTEDADFALEVVSGLARGIRPGWRPPRCEGRDPFTLIKTIPGTQNNRLPLPLVFSNPDSYVTRDFTKSPRWAAVLTDLFQFPNLLPATPSPPLYIFTLYICHYVMNVFTNLDYKYCFKCTASAKDSDYLALCRGC